MAAPRYVSPLRYPGGKARMAGFLADLYGNQFGLMDVEVWIEPFAGGAGAGLTMLAREEVGEVWLTEKHPALAALWRCVLAGDDALAHRVETTTADLSLWEWAREQVAASAAGESVPDDDLGFAALVVNRCSRSGIVTPSAGPIGGKAQTGRWTVASRWNPDGIAERLRFVRSLRHSIRFTEGDAVQQIRSLGGCGFEDEVLLLVDPPYLREGNRLYANGMTEHDHQALADALTASPARWVLTYDDEPEVLRLYPDQRVLAYEIPNTANRQRIATEYAVFSDNLALPPLPQVLPKGSVRWVRHAGLVAVTAAA